MIFSKKTHDGELFVDHRASPGVPETAAQRMGYHPNQVKEGAVFECATLGCKHCGSCVVLNQCVLESVLGVLFATCISATVAIILESSLVMFIAHLQK